MSNFDVTAIGTAFVDVVANVTEDFLEHYCERRRDGRVAGRQGGFHRQGVQRHDGREFQGRF